MAFQAIAAPNVSVVANELWPSLAAGLHANTPLRLSAGSQVSPSQQPYKPPRQPYRTTKAILPECLRTVKALPSSTPGVMRAHISSMSLYDALSPLRPGMLSAANPVMRRLPARLSPPSRHMSTVSAFQKDKLQKPLSISKLQYRALSLFNRAPALTTNQLARLEDAANKMPNSGTVQGNFYEALLRANMPAIVVERYQSGHFASNRACEAAYQRALTQLGAADNSAVLNQQNGAGNLNHAQLQALGQAVAASSRGGNIAVSRGTNGSGGKESPMYVVIEETIGSVIFKWVRLLLYFALFGYISLAVITFAIDTLTPLKTAGAKADNEAKPKHQTVRFSDVHGCPEAKEELQELVDFLKAPDKFSTLGGKLPKGVLLVGPPGTGKTLLARAVAGEAGVPFFFMSGSEFDEVYVGVGAKRVRDLFANAKAKAPAIIFIDELDAIGGRRNPRDSSYAKQTLNQLLTELDGFEKNNGVIIIAATNFPELLDKALTRPGRFDRNVVVGLPDVRGRMEILKHHMKAIVPANDVNLEQLAAGTPGFSGADLENIINQAAVHASKARAKAVKMKDFEWAKDKVMMGAEKRNMVISPVEKEMTAYHEAGHALVGMFTKGANQLHKITIMPRGNTLGVTMHLPEMDKYSMSMSEYKALIDVAMGGKVAENLVYGHENVTSGVAGDLQSATQVAYQMVTQFGMSDKLGNVDLYSNYNRLSSETKQQIEDEVRKLLEEGRERAMKLLVEKRTELDRLAKALVSYETLDREEAFKVIRGEPLEGKLELSDGNIKMPGGGPSRIEMSPIPGSADADGQKAPPKGPVLV